MGGAAEAAPAPVVSVGSTTADRGTCAGVHANCRTARWLRAGTSLGSWTQQIKGLHGCVVNAWPDDRNGHFVSGPHVLRTSPPVFPT